jgi:hypothetical protein
MVKNITYFLIFYWLSNGEIAALILHKNIKHYNIFIYENIKHYNIFIYEKY